MGERKKKLFRKIYDNIPTLPLENQLLISLELRKPN